MRRDTMGGTPLLAVHTYTPMSNRLTFDSFNESPSYVESVISRIKQKKKKENISILIIVMLESSLHRVDIQGETSLLLKNKINFDFQLQPISISTWLNSCLNYLAFVSLGLCTLL